MGGGSFCSVVLRVLLGLVALRVRRGLWRRLVGWVAKLGCLASSCCFVSLRVVSLVRLRLAGGLVGWVGGRRLVAAASRGGGVSLRRRLAAAASRGGVSRVLLSAASVFASLIVSVAHSAAVSVVGSSDWRCPFARVQLV